MFRNVRAFQDRIGIWKCWFLRRGENRSSGRKTSRSRVENQQQTQPTYDGGSGNRTRATLVGGERSHHFANPAPMKSWMSSTKGYMFSVAQKQMVVACGTLVLLEHSYDYTNRVVKSTMWSPASENHPDMSRNAA